MSPFHLLLFHDVMSPNQILLFHNLLELKIQSSLLKHLICRHTRKLFRFVSDFWSCNIFWLLSELCPLHFWWFYCNFINKSCKTKPRNRNTIAQWKYLVHTAHMNCFWNSIKATRIKALYFQTYIKKLRKNTPKWIRDKSSFEILTQSFNSLFFLLSHFSMALHQTQDADRSLMAI